MSRWLNDSFFQRVVTLVLILVSVLFTLILVMVFMDINGFTTDEAKSQSNNNNIQEDALQEAEYINFDDYKEENNPDNEYIHKERKSDENFRKKRSMIRDERLQKLTQNIKNDKVKEALTNRLSKLLDELNIEKSSTEKPIFRNNLKMKEVPTEKFNKEDFKHLALHNILLKGIVEHVDISDVYNKIRELFKVFSLPTELKSTNNLEADVLSQEKDKQVINGEDEILNEFLNCTTLKKQVVKSNETLDKTNDHSNYNSNYSRKGPDLLIKTTIDISAVSTEANNTDKDNDTKNIKGIFNFLYNGRPIKLNKEIFTSVTETTESSRAYEILDESISRRKDFINQLLQDYHKRYRGMSSNFEVNKQRVKRSNQIMYKNIHNKRITKDAKNNNKKKENDVYVRIQTHFNKNSLMGEKRKKLLENVIFKIEKVIASNLRKVTSPHMSKKIYSQIKKRTQNPLKYLKKMNKRKYRDNHLGKLKKRYLDPIADDYTKTKSNKTDIVNEDNIENIDISSNHLNMYDNDISQRQQEPILQNINNDDITFLVNDIGDTGFTVGISQYVDKIADPHELKLFNNVDNVIRTYNNNNDYYPEVNVKQKYLNYQKHRNKRWTNFNNKANLKHTSNDDYHYSDYIRIFSHKPLKLFPYKTYKEIYDGDNQGGFRLNNNDKINLTAINNLIMNSQLNPSEILTLTNLISKRRKRFIHLNKQTRTKMHANKLINKKFNRFTKIILKKKIRNKRNTYNDNYARHSNENMFFVSNENMYADRAVIKDSYHSKDDQDIYNQEPEDYRPHTYLNSRYSPEHNLNNFFDSVRTSQNSLVRKYPHIFLEDSRSKEHNIYSYPEEYVNLEDVTKNERNYYSKETDSQYIMPPAGSKSNYKVTVKILPRNVTDDASGFREVHTCINKTYSKNGMAYVSLLNIKEISKIEKINNTVSSINDQSDRDYKIEQMLRTKKDKITDQLKKLEYEKQKIEHIIGHTSTSNPNLNENRAIDQDKKQYSLTQLDSKKNALSNSLLQSNDANQTNNPYGITTPDVVNALRTQFQALTDVDKVAILNLLLVTKKTNQATTKKPILINLDNLNIELKNREVLPKTQDILNKIDKNTQVLERILDRIDFRIEGKKGLFSVNNIRNPPVELQNTDINNSSMPYIFQYHPKIPQNPIASVLYHGMVYNPENFTFIEPSRHVINKFSGFPKNPFKQTNENILHKPVYDNTRKSVTYNDTLLKTIDKTFMSNNN